MRDSIWDRIRRYLGIWLLIVLALCLISIARNWDIFISVISNDFMGIVYVFTVIGVSLYGLVLIIRGGFR